MMILYCHDKYQKHHYIKILRIITCINAQILHINIFINIQNVLTDIYTYILLYTSKNFLIRKKKDINI